MSNSFLLSDYYFIINDKFYNSWKEGYSISLVNIQSKDPSYDIGLDGIAFFNTLPVRDYPLFLQNSINEIGKGYTNTSGISFGPDKGSPYDDIPPIPAYKVELGTFCGTRVISFKDFYTLCLEFIDRSSEAVVFFDLVRLGIVDKNWLISIKKSKMSIIEKIEKLKF